MFKFFTERLKRPSLRLQIVARGFQAVGLYLGVLRGAQLIASIAVAIHYWPRRSEWYGSSDLIFSLVQGVSLLIIGRALHRRQRWGAYLAAVTIGAPFVRQVLSPYAPILSIQGIFVSMLGLGLIVTVWDELGTVRDDDFADDRHDNGSSVDHSVITPPNNFAQALERDAAFSKGDDDDVELPTRQRGFDEPRLPLQSVLQSASEFPASDSKPVAHCQQVEVEGRSS